MPCNIQYKLLRQNNMTKTVCTYSVCIWLPSSLLYTDRRTYSPDQGRCHHWHIEHLCIHPFLEIRECKCKWKSWNSFVSNTDESAKIIIKTTTTPATTTSTTTAKHCLKSKRKKMRRIAHQWLADSFLFLEIKVCRHFPYTIDI